jgi:aminoglycoside phosphotransferase (APT) family kinase protein
LYRYVKAAAEAVHVAARRTESNPGGCATLVHGDFKMANIILSPSPGPPVVIDWQWVGPGSAAHDVMFFLYTSLSFEAIEEEDHLVRLYHERLAGDLRARGSAGAAAAEAYTKERLSGDVAVHAADHARFTIGSILAHANCANYGIHRRSLGHLTRLVRAAAAGLDAVLERDARRSEEDDDARQSASSSLERR